MPIRDFGEMQYNADILIALDLCKKWSEKSDNPEIQLMVKTIMNIAFYVNGLSMERQGFDMAIEEVRDQVRAERRKVKDLEETVQDYKLQIKMENEI